MQVASVAPVASPLPRRAPTTRSAAGRAGVAGIGASIVRVLSAAVRLSSDLQHLSPREQRDLALDWLHRSDSER